jgi:hypothetical protein
MRPCIPKQSTGGAPGKAGGGKAKGAKLASFATDTARKAGTSERAVQRDATRAKALGPDLDRIAGTSLDRRSREVTAAVARPWLQAVPT